MPTEKIHKEESHTKRPLEERPLEEAIRKRERSKRFTCMNCTFLFFLGLGFIAICLYAQSWSHAATASLWALAALASGAFAGLLFGIQRVRQKKPTEDAEPGTPPGYQTEINNNLSEVSDWLTKIIVGIGLIELSSLPTKLHKAALPLATCLGGDCGLAVAVGIIIFFGVIGFLIGFIDYRTFLAILIRDSDDQLFSIPEYVKGMTHKATQEMTEIVEERAKKTAQEAQQITENVAIAGDALQMAQFAESVTGPSQGPRKSEAIEHLNEALQILQSARKDLPTNRTLAIMGGRLLQALHRSEDSISILKETLANRRKANITPDTDDAALLFNIACYENLAAQELDKSGNVAEAENHRKPAWESLESSCKLDTNNKTAAASDPDLTTLFKPGVRDLASL
jgi:tetratricopeptide (TPR) repeat protein